MSSTHNTSKAAVLSQMQSVIAGLQKHNASASFTLAGTTYTTASLVTLFQSAIDAIAAANAAQTAATDAVAAMHGVEAKTGPVFVALKQNLQNSLGASSTTLADYGLAPRKKPAPLTTEQLAAKKAKAEATRAARGTTSKKKKLAVSGNVNGVTITPVTASAATPPASPQPVPATAPTTGK